jgi:serine/threonine protein kinase
VTFAGNENSRLVISSKYAMFMSASDLLGEGTSSICRTGECCETGAAVAVKVYKTQTCSTILQKFHRQIEVLEELQRPFESVEGAPWSDRLQGVAPYKVFMRLIDYSKSSDGVPGPDAADGGLYVVTEVGQYSLKDYIKRRRDEGRQMSKACVKSIIKAMVLVTAGLHAKGFVHLDLKPENLLVFGHHCPGRGGRLKLIDVDGCVKMGSVVTIDDSSLSYSPCYCAPEWAKFMIDGSADPKITISPALDVWSVGLTACELVTCKAALSKNFSRFQQPGVSKRQALFQYMDWLSEMKTCPLSNSVREFDGELVDLLKTCLLVGSPLDRKPLAESLNHPYLGEEEGLIPLGQLNSSPITNDVQQTPKASQHDKIVSFAFS